MSATSCAGQVNRSTKLTFMQEHSNVELPLNLSCFSSTGKVEIAACTRKSIGP